MEKEILEELKKTNQKLDLLIDALRVDRNPDYEGESVGYYLQHTFETLANWDVDGIPNKREEQ